MMTMIAKHITNIITQPTYATDAAKMIAQLYGSLGSTMSQTKATAQLHSYHHLLEILNSAPIMEHVPHARK